MKTEHEELVDDLALALPTSREAEEGGYSTFDIVMCILYAAEQQGYVLARLPDRREQDTAQGWDHISSWNNCLDAIATIEIEDES
jgi:hypothetical protein